MQTIGLEKIGIVNMSEKEKSKGKICPEGKAWAKRTFDVYPSAYANLGASKYCKDPNYARKSKKRNGGFVSIRGEVQFKKRKQDE